MCAWRSGWWCCPSPKPVQLPTTPEENLHLKYPLLWFFKEYIHHCCICNLRSTLQPRHSGYPSIPLALWGLRNQRTAAVVSNAVMPPTHLLSSTPLLIPQVPSVPPVQSLLRRFPWKAWNFGSSINISFCRWWLWLAFFSYQSRRQVLFFFFSCMLNLLFRQCLGDMNRNLTASLFWSWNSHWLIDKYETVTLISLWIWYSILGNNHVLEF